MTSLKYTLKGLPQAPFLQMMRLNFGGQTAAQQEELINNPGKQNGSCNTATCDPDTTQEQEEEHLTLDLWDE